MTELTTPWDALGEASYRARLRMREWFMARDDQARVDRLMERATRLAFSDATDELHDEETP